MSDLLFKSALLVEDEPSLASALQVALNQLTIPSQTVSTLAEARKVLAQTSPDFILLDRILPDGDGIQLCTSLRRSGYDGTILILTASGTTEDRVQGLNEGADDYLPKPFSWRELEARIRALARRRPKAEMNPKSGLPSLWTIQPSQLRVLGPKGWVQLTPLEFKLAARMIQNAGEIVTRDDLLKDVWGFQFLPKTRTVDHFLGRLRRHFEEVPDKPSHFLTIRGAGYRFEP